MTDSTGVLFLKTDTLEAFAKTPLAKRLKEQEKKMEDWQKEQEKKKKRGEPYDSIMPQPKLDLKLSNVGSITPLQTIGLEMLAPLVRCDTSAVHLYSKIDTLWYEAPYEFKQTGVRTYRIRGEWHPGTEYSLEIDSAAFESIYGLVSDYLKKGIKVKTEDECGTLVVNVSGAEVDTASVIVQLLSGGDKVAQQTTVGSDGAAAFFYLAPGKYYLKAFIEQELKQGSGMSETEIRAKYKAFKDRRFNEQIAALAKEYGIENSALENFVNETVKLRRIDEDVLREMLSHIDSWKLRKAAKEGLLVSLAPLFNLLTGGNTIEGLSAYVKE
jgi:hypothetical protein